MGHYTRRSMAVLWIAICMALAGCPSQPPTNKAVPPQGTSLLIRVLKIDGTPLDGASVSLGGQTLLTDSNGNALFENLTSGNAVAQVRAPGFAPRTVVAELADGVNGVAFAPLMPFEPPITFNAGTGATIQSKGMQVIIPAGALVDESGQPVTGEAEAYVAPIDPSTEAIQGSPGPFVGISASGGGSVDIESGFLAEISLVQNGQQLQLAPGATATLRFNLAPTLAASAPPGTRIPAWWFDLAAGVWREEGAGVVEESAQEPGKRVWVAQVSHFTWWNADQPITTHACVNATVNDESGRPVSGLYVVLSGVDYSYSRWSVTDASGRTPCISAKLGGTARVYVDRVTSAGSSVNITPRVNAACGSGGSCEQVVLTVPASACGAPGTMEACSTYQGPAGTENVGTCRASVRVCDGRNWGPCSTQVVPANEVCDGRDNNCDGQTDEGNPGGGAVCRTGRQGACDSGTKVCSRGTFICAPTTAPTNEVCDGKDNNCDGQTDEGNPGGGAVCQTGQPGACATGTKTCGGGGSFICRPNVAPTNEVCDGQDNNCDGQTDEGNPGSGATCNTGQPGVCAQGSTACSGGSLTCSQTVAPSSEVCDGQDNNCDGQTDEGNPGGGAACNTGQPGVCAQGSTVCSSGSVTCNRTNAPGTEVCDGLDNDCDGQTDEGNPGAGASCNTGQPGVCARGNTVCSNGSLTCTGIVAPSIEVCDGLDNDCDGQVDQGNPGAGAACGTGQPGVCAQGTSACTNGSLVCGRNVAPSNEVCDGLDNDCDGQADEGNPDGGAACNTGQPGVCAQGTMTCNGGSLACVPSVGPSAEVCDGLDNDCNGQIDEGNPGAGMSCNTGEQGVCAQGTTTCNSGALVCNRTAGPSAEVCDAQDNDCDGQTDEGNPGGGMACSTGQPGVCAQGTTVCSGGSVVCRADQMATEVCDGLDNDCDGQIDNTCPAGTTYFLFNTTDTTSATRNTIDRTVVLQAGQVLEVGTCGIPHATSTNDSVLRLVGPNSAEVASNDDGPECTDGSSYLSYRVPAGTGGTYTIRAGCFAENACSGTVGYRVSTP